jgi:hypothetical protein
MCPWPEKEPPWPEKEPLASAYCDLCHVRVEVELANSGRQMDVHRDGVHRMESSTMIRYRVQETLVNGESDIQINGVVAGRQRVRHPDKRHRGLNDSGQIDETRKQLSATRR